MGSYLILILILIYIYLNYTSSTETMSSESVLTENNIFDNIDKINFKIPVIDIKPGKTYEIMALPQCKKKFNVTYFANINYIMNEGKQIYQDMLKPLEQKAEIGLESHGLTRVSFRKSVLTWNGKRVGLELNFLHINPKNGKRVRVVFPLSLEKTTERFTNTNNTNKNTNKNVLKKFINNPSDIPEYKKGQVTVGKMLKIDLCGPSKILLNQEKFYFGRSPDGELLLISKPVPYDIKLGSAIRKQLLDPY